MEHAYIYFLVIALFAIIQSVFGMGLLVFGTPTLLMLGYDFSSVLGLLLPSSILISLTQVITTSSVTFQRRERLNMLICALFVVLSLGLLLRLNIKINIDILVGAVLIFSALVRFSATLLEKMKYMLSRHERLFIAIMGGVHGVTNMGGALLALYASSINREKLKIRTAISRYYLLFGLIQLVTLAIFKWSALSFRGFAAAPLALLVYLALGNILFKKASAPAYDKLMTSFITLYGVVILARGYL